MFEQPDLTILSSFCDLFLKKNSLPDFLIFNIKIDFYKKLLLQNRSNTTGEKVCRATQLTNVWTAKLLGTLQLLSGIKRVLKSSLGNLNYLPLLSRKRFRRPRCSCNWKRLRGLKDPVEK